MNGRARPASPASQGLVHEHAQGHASRPVPAPQGRGWRPYDDLADPCPASYRGTFSEWLNELKTPGTCPTCGARTLLVVAATKLMPVETQPHERQRDRAEELLGGRLEELERLRRLLP